MALSEDLYRDVILDHSQNPRHSGMLADADVVSEGNNPLCGDQLTLSLKDGAGRIAAIGIDAKGCSISQASASMLAEALEGKTVAEAHAIVHGVKAMLKGEIEPWDEDDDISALAGVRKYPVRIKCALLAWTTLEQALASLEAKG